MIHWILWWGSCSETTCLLLLKGKSDQRQSQCIPKNPQQYIMCPLSEEPENNICPSSRMNFQTCLPCLKPGAALLRLSLEYAPFPSLPSLQMASQPTPLVRRPNASILCLLQNLVSLTPPSLYPPSQSYPTAPKFCVLYLKRWKSFWPPSTLTRQLDRIASAHVS